MDTYNTINLDILFIIVATGGTIGFLLAAYFTKAWGYMFAGIPFFSLYLALIGQLL